MGYYYYYSVCTGEVVRIYDERESTQALWWLASCYSIGLVVGPVIPLAFERIRFQVGPILIGQYNFLGVFMAGLFFVVLVISNLFMHDCSKQFDLKASTQIVNNEITTNDEVIGTTYADLYRKTDEKSNGSDDNPATTPSVLRTIKKLFSNADVALLFVSTLICMYSMFSVDVLVPLIFQVILQWHLSSLAIFLVLSGVLYALLLALMSRLCSSNRSLHITMVACLCGAVLMHFCIVAIKFKPRAPVTDVVLVTLLGIFWLLTTCTEEVLLRAILARKVQSSVQSFTEAVRNGIASSAAILGALTTPLLLPFVDWWSLVMMCVMAVLIGAFLWRRRSLVSADVIDFELD